MYMQYKYKIFEKIIIILSFLVLFVVCIIFLINSNLKPMYATSISVDQIIKNIKIENQNLKLIAENNTIKNLYNIVYLDNNKYKSYIIDTITGKELSFKDLITNEKDYLSKENELLKLKYPEYIVNGLNNKKVQKVYNIKPNEVTIYYYNYQLDYDYPNELNLTINYNEIKDYLKFEPILDETYENENGYNYQKGVKTVALTFDDGPSKPYNSLILNELAKNKAHATFFMVGTMMNACQNCVLNTYKSGNEIGSHSWEHMNIASKKQDKVKTSLDKVNTLYTKITNDTIKLLRPPYGSYNKTNLNNINMPLILWNLDTLDWKYRDASHIINYITKNVSDGSIILMHELYGTSYEALKVVLPKLHSMGYQVVSVSELAALKGKTLQPGHAYAALK